jgi:ribokinase
LRASEVTVDGISRIADHHTGIALIAVGQSGENQIIIVPGASQQLTASQADPFIRDAKVLLTQLEAPPHASLQVSQAAKGAGAIIIHDPAPAPYMALDQAHFEVIDIITPNARKALALTGIDPSSDEGARQAAHALRNMGATAAVVKLGRRGCYVSGPQMERLVPAFPVAAIDTVGAGDAFNGGLAHALAKGWSFEAAIRFAAATGALATTVRGSAAAAPSLQAVQALLRAQDRCLGSVQSPPE